MIGCAANPDGYKAGKCVAIWPQSTLGFRVRQTERQALSALVRKHGVDPKQVIYGKELHPDGNQLIIEAIYLFREIE